MNVETGFQLADVWGFVRRRAKYMAVVAGVISLAAYWLAMALPNEYESSSTILVEPQSVSKDLVEAGVPDSDLNSRLHLMTAQILSRARLSRIIDELDLYQEESKSLLREEIIGMMRERIRVAPVLSELETSCRKASDVEINTFRISFRHNDARTAMLVAQRLGNDFIEQHISERVKLSQKSLEFIQTELDRLSTQIREIEAQVAQVKAANPGRMPQEIASNQLRLDRDRRELAGARRSLAEARRRAFYRSQSTTAASMGGPERRAEPGAAACSSSISLCQYQARGFTRSTPTIKPTRSRSRRSSKLEKEGGRRVGSRTSCGRTPRPSRRARLQAGRRGGGDAPSQQADEIRPARKRPRGGAARGPRARLQAPVRELPGVQQQAARSDRAGQPGTPPARRAVPRARGRLHGARTHFAQPCRDRDPRRVVRARDGRRRRNPARGDRSPSTRASSRPRCGFRCWRRFRRSGSSRIARRKGGHVRTALAMVAVGVFGLVGGAVGYVWVNGVSRARSPKVWPLRRPSLSRPVRHRQNACRHAAGRRTAPRPAEPGP
jgi:hypothetical protein